MSKKTDNILKGFKKTKDQNAVTVEQGKFLIDGFDGVDNPGLLPFTKNCLLYTSPSPRDLSTSRMPSSA